MLVPLFSLVACSGMNGRVYITYLDYFYATRDGLVVSPFGT